jgi:adenylate cyclase
MTSLGLSTGIFVAVVLVLSVLLSFFLNRTVIDPVKQIGEVCAAVTAGDFERRVQVARSDEIGALGATVNDMVQGLYERFHLTRFVSSSTIESIRGSDGASRARLTLLFSDIRGFTSYAETRDPEHVIDVLNRILNVQAALISDAGGDIDKFVGDEVVAVFAGDGQEIAACRAASQIQHSIFGADPKLFDGLDVGIGINTGEVIHGSVGSEKRADFTVIGDQVNFASRLCDAAKAGEILIAERTRRAAGGAIAARGPYRARVKGREQAERIYILERMA